MEIQIGNVRRNIGPEAVELLYQENDYLRNCITTLKRDIETLERERHSTVSSATPTVIKDDR